MTRSSPSSTPSPGSTPDACAGCPVAPHVGWQRYGIDPSEADAVVALAGNPNTGKSTVFNALTGLRQHVGNWPGKTVARAEGAFGYGGRRYRLIDLPGTYSLLSRSADEDVARDALLFGAPDVTVVVADATRLERNLNLVLQVLEITPRVVVALNLIDEAERHGLQVDARALARRLGVPVVGTAARSGVGIPALLGAIEGVAFGAIDPRPRRSATLEPELERAVRALVRDIERAYPGLANARWVALRLLEGDPSVERAVREGSLGSAARPRAPLPEPRVVGAVP